MNDNEIWKSFSDKSRMVEKGLDPLERKRTGSYYTVLSLTDAMMSELIDYMDAPANEIINRTFLEPCVGSGNFVLSYINLINKKYHLNSQDAIQLLERIYVSDILDDAINCYKDSLRCLAKYLWNIELSEDYFNKHIGGGLLFDVSANNLEYIPVEDVFPGIKFDIIATNPPYKNLKAERSQYDCDEAYEEDKKKYNSISSLVSKRFMYTTDGVLNLYKLFVEEIVDKYASDNAYISLLIPSSITSDKTCEKLRTHIIKTSKLVSVQMIKEDSGFVEAHQSLCTILLQKGRKTDRIKVVKDYRNNPNDCAFVDVDVVLNDRTGNAIVAVSEDEYSVLKKLRTFPVVKDLDFIVNQRGELDLTANKSYITSAKTDYPFLRGRNIGRYHLVGLGVQEYAEPSFVAKTNKRRFIEKERIVCQQIANIHKRHRVTFSYVPSNYILGNSCNFISVYDNDYGIDIYSLLGLFNTNIIDWLFKLTSSNNHINNYEIDCFPIPVDSPYLIDISKLVQNYLRSNDNTILEEVEMLARKAYGLVEEGESQMSNNQIIHEFCSAINILIDGVSEKDAEKILDSSMDIESLIQDVSDFDSKVLRGIVSKYRSLYNGYILNHSTFKLSNLDLEMIKSVPQGGSWKDIPMGTVKKSKRLERITKTGGRTTLYGRIDYDKPSYTITTYFNRPGNGTYVHPVHERVISVREAARFQTFCDDYYFYGNKTQLLKQVGNAVPTLLAYQIGQMIVNKTGCNKSIDLFCGAGGMTAGFKAAGITSMLSNDIEESACITLKINNPEIPVLCGDITHNDVKDAIEKAAKNGSAEIICGGPPCQGFSMAGFRADDDPRNQLFREFVDIVNRVTPKVIVFENVEGLLSYQNGKTYREVHTLFEELGYKTEGRLLKTNYYGVPQKRKRVIIICTRNDLEVNPSELYPEPITVDESLQLNARDAIADLELVECSDTAKYIDCEDSILMKLLKGRITYKEYVDELTSRK